MQGPSPIGVHGNKCREFESGEWCLCGCTTFCRVLLSSLSSAQQRQLKVFATRLHKAEVRHSSAISKDAGLVLDAWNRAQWFGLQHRVERALQQHASKCERGARWFYATLAYHTRA